jgi:hypothetical protein
MNGPGKNDPKFEGPGKLIGGFASGNLSEREQEALFDAALHDQELFNALMDEQALKDLLDEPGVKAELMQSLQPKVTLLGRIKSFLATPVAWGTMGAVATAAILLVVILPTTRKPDVAPQTAQVRRDELQAKKTIVAPPPAATPANPVVEPVPSSPRRDQPADERREPLAAVKEQEKREQAGGQAQPASPKPVEQPQQQAQAQQERDRQQLPAPPMQSQVPQQLPQMVRQQPVPAAAVGAVGQVLALDYTLLRRAADGSYQTATAVRATDAVRLQVMPSESGYITLYRRSAEGLMTTLANAQPVMRGQVVQVPQQGSLQPSDAAYVLVLSRDAVSSDAAKSAAPGAIGGFRQNAGELKARRSASAAPSAAVLDLSLMDLSLRKAVLPSVSLGRVAASSPESRTVAVEITIRAEN